jgi:hypothetical protein
MLKEAGEENATILVLLSSIGTEPIETTKKELQDQAQKVCSRSY